MIQTDIFQQASMARLSERLDKLSQDRKPAWGKMNPSQMLAHLNVMFELGLEEKHQPPNALLRFMLKAFVKNKVIGDKPYVKGSSTAPEMRIRHQPGFQTEKKRFLLYLTLLNEKGNTYFEQRAHPSFGKLSATEWSNLFYKHIDHHFNQFGI